jgi:hypothetical protein
MSTILDRAKTFLSAFDGITLYDGHPAVIVRELVEAIEAKPSPPAHMSNLVEDASLVDKADAWDAVAAKNVIIAELRAELASVRAEAADRIDALERELDEGRVGAIAAIADIRKVTGLGAKPMLTELAAAIKVLLSKYAFERDEARQQRDTSQAEVTRLKEALAKAEVLADPETFVVWLRAWCKDRFGKWITHSTARRALDDFRARSVLEEQKP